MTPTMRPTPPFDADERSTLDAWLDFYRATLALKCDGLDDHALRTAAAPPSPLTLLGLVQHLAEVERNWFRRVLAGEDAPPIFGPADQATGHDGGFALSAQVTFETARTTWEHEIGMARKNCAAVDLEDTRPLMGQRVRVRWIYLHMIAEYARHCGHADMIREQIDGAVGV